MRGETAFIRGLTAEEKRQIRTRTAELHLTSESAYWLRLVRSDLAQTAGHILSGINYRICA